MELPKELVVLLLAALPLTELRAALPLGISVYGLSVASAFFWSVLGNVLITLVILWLLDPAVNLLSRISWFQKFFHWLFERTRNKALKQYLKYGQWALVIFVAIPLPGTGAWSGALIAYLFGIPKWRAFLLVSLGVLIAGLIVLLATLGIIKIFNPLL